MAPSNTNTAPLVRSTPEPSPTSGVLLKKPCCISTGGGHHPRSFCFLYFFSQFLYAVVVTPSYLSYMRREVKGVSFNSLCFPHTRTHTHIDIRWCFTFFPSCRERWRVGIVRQRSRRRRQRSRRPPFRCHIHSEPPPEGQSKSPFAPTPSSLSSFRRSILSLSTVLRDRGLLARPHPRTVAWT